MSELLNIYQRVNKVMEQCNYLQKKQAQQGKGIRYDEVMAMIRPLLIANGIVMVTTQDSLECLNNVEGTKQKVYQGKFSLKLVNIDNPSEVIEHTAYAHGMDGGDKGAGKAHTYAMKTMLVKGFGIETGEDEESRAEKLEALDTSAEALLIEDCTDIDQLVSVWKQINDKYKGKKMPLEISKLKDAKKTQLFGEN